MYFCCFLFVMFVSKLFCFCLLLVTFSHSVFKLLHLQSKNNIQKQKEQQKELREKHTKRKTLKRKQQKYIISQPEPERYLFLVGSRAGYPVFLFVLFFSRSFSVSFLCCFMFCLFSPSLFRFLPEHNTIHYTKDKQT